MYELTDYFLNGSFGVALGTLWILGAWLAKYLAAKRGILTVRQKVFFALVISLIYIVACLPTGIPFFVSDVLGFCWIHAMVGFAIGIFPVCVFALLSKKKKTVRIYFAVSLYLLSLAYMSFQLLI
jgi:hypothetical protein